MRKAVDAFSELLDVAEDAIEDVEIPEVSIPIPDSLPEILDVSIPEVIIPIPQELPEVSVPEIPEVAVDIAV